MSSKPYKWLFAIKGGRHERNQREFSIAGFIFTCVKNIFLALLRGGGGIAPIARPYGSATRRRIGLYMQCDAFPFSHSVACKLLAVHRNKIVVLAECYRRSSVHKKITYNDMLQSVGLL